MNKELKEFNSSLVARFTEKVRIEHYRDKTTGIFSAKSIEYPGMLATGMSLDTAVKTLE